MQTTAMDLSRLALLFACRRDRSLTFTQWRIWKHANNPWYVCACTLDISSIYRLFAAFERFTVDQRWKSMEHCRCNFNIDRNRLLTVYWRLRWQANICIEQHESEVAMCQHLFKVNRTVLSLFLSLSVHCADGQSKENATTVAAIVIVVNDDERNNQ
jgi:hypothetical protein